jgi:hypothetical protein
MNKDRNLLDACDGYFLRDEISCKGIGREQYTPTIYFLTKNEEIVYIGESGKPLSRFYSHKQQSSPLKDEWNKVYFKSFEQFIKGDNLRHIEGRALTYLNRMTLNKSYKRIGDPDINPLSKFELDLYLANVRADYYKRLYEQSENNLILHTDFYPLISKNKNNTQNETSRHFNQRSGTAVS